MWADVQLLSEQCRYAFFNELRNNLLILAQRYGCTEERLVAIGVLEPAASNMTWSILRTLAGMQVCGGKLHQAKRSAPSRNGWARPPAK